MFTDRLHKKYDKLKEPWRFLIIFIAISILFIFLSEGYSITVLPLLLTIMDRLRYIENNKKNDNERST